MFRGFIGFRFVTQQQSKHFLQTKIFRRCKLLSTDDNKLFICFEMNKYLEKSEIGFKKLYDTFYIYYKTSSSFSNMNIITRDALTALISLDSQIILK